MGGEGTVRRESGGAGRGVGARSEATGDLTEDGRAWRVCVVVRVLVAQSQKSLAIFACGMVLAHIGYASLVLLDLTGHGRPSVLTPVTEAILQ